MPVNREACTRCGILLDDAVCSCGQSHASISTKGKNMCDWCVDAVRGRHEELARELRVEFSESSNSGRIFGIPKFVGFLKNSD